jgi:hypothetical protein
MHVRAKCHHSNMHVRDIETMNVLQKFFVWV